MPFAQLAEAATPASEADAILKGVAASVLTLTAGGLGLWFKFRRDRAAARREEVAVDAEAAKAALDSRKIAIELEARHHEVEAAHRATTIDEWKAFAANLQKRIAELEKKVERMAEDHREKVEQLTAAHGKCEVEAAKLSTRVEFLTAQNAEQQKAIDELRRRLTADEGRVFPMGPDGPGE